MDINRSDEMMINYSVNRAVIYCMRNNEISEKTAVKTVLGPKEVRSELLDQILKDLEEGSESFVEPKESKHYREWMATIDGAGPFSHLYTLAFARRYSDDESIAAVRRLIKMVIRAVCGSRWRDSDCFLTGVAVAERHKISQDFRGRLHFHVLLNTSELEIDTRRLGHIARKCSLRLYDRFGRSMTDVGRVDLREIYAQRGVVGYLLKNLYSPYWEPGDNISFIGRSTGLDDFLLPRLSAKDLTMHH